MSPSTDEYENARSATVTILSQLMTGETGVLLAARRLVIHRFALIGDVLDDDWRVFVAIDSETDHLPTGRERVHWQSEALAEKDAEIQESERFYRDKALVAAKNLIDRYRKRAEPGATDNPEGAK